MRDAWLADRFGAGWAGIPYGIGVSPTTPDIAYATDSGRVMRTADGGKTWNPAYSNRAIMALDRQRHRRHHLLQRPLTADPRHMFISYTDIGLWASDNGGESWYSATRNGVPHQWVNTTYWIAFDPKVQGRIWAAMSGTHDLPRPKMWRRNSPDSFTGGITRSDDGGRTWRVLNNGMPQTAATHILRDPSGALYVSGFGRGVFKSTDDGEHWEQKNAGLEGAQPFAWRIVRDSKGALYLIVARRSDDGTYGNSGDGALYRSTDGAEHWTRLTLPDGVTARTDLPSIPAIRRASISLPGAGAGGRPRPMAASTSPPIAESRGAEYSLKTSTSMTSRSMKRTRAHSTPRASNPASGAPTIADSRGNAFPASILNGRTASSSTQTTAGSSSSPPSAAAWVTR